jgi:hypothetical protein
MNPRTALLRAAAAAALLTATLGLAGAAAAQTMTVIDGADATASLSDIRRVTVAHRTSDVGVRITFTDLRGDSAAGLRINIDTDGSLPGPEFALVSGLGSGTDYQLFRVTDWRIHGAPKTCSNIATIDWSTDVFGLHVARSCIGSPAEVRVGVRMTDNYDASHPITDWMLGTRRFTGWMVRG